MGRFDVTYQCPALFRYEAQWLKAAADEPKGPKTKQLLSDYKQLRDACRAIEAK